MDVHGRDAADGGGDLGIVLFGDGDGAGRAERGSSGEKCMQVCRWFFRRENGCMRKYSNTVTV